MEENKDLNRIKVMLAEKKRTNKWLAEQLGVNPATVSKWCTNSSQPSLDMLGKIAEALKVDYTELKYDSGVNIMGSVPNYNVMLDYISDTYGITEGSTGAFEFRTEKSLRRFIAAIESCILKFNNETHKSMFFDALANKDFSTQERLVVLFWQLTYSNRLFSRITAEVFMKAVYSGRITITAEEVTSFLRYIKETEKGELDWSEDTIKISGSKYLTIMKKLGLADGAIKKTIVHPVITNNLFVYFIRFIQTVSDDKTLHNPYMIFSFSEEPNIVSRLKKIENIQYWDISQIGNEITIDLKP